MKGSSCKWRVLISVFVIVLIALFQFPAPAHASDSPCIHGMRIVGEQSIYLLHMGLFNNSCHDYQGLFEVSFEGANHPQTVYLDAQKKNSNQNEFTIEPTQKFVLPELAAGKFTSFKAKVYSGQYERSATNPKLLDGDVTVKVKRVLHFRQFEAGVKQPPTSEYLLFGNTVEQLAAHLITASPDFDQIVAVKTPLPLTNADLAKAVRLVLPNRPTPNAKVNLAQALKLGDKPAVQVNGQQPNRAIEAGNQYFLETADYK